MVSSLRLGKQWTLDQIPEIPTWHATKYHTYLTDVFKVNTTLHFVCYTQKHQTTNKIQNLHDLNLDLA